MHRLFRYFRSRRMARFESTFAINNDTTVLDVGGSAPIWQFATVRPKLTFFNLPPAVDKSISDADLVGGDGRCLPFRDNAFDIVFSNSTIEHVGTRDDQTNFANEIRRVGKRYWVQTPNRYFPFEMHLMLPLIHYLPREWQRAIVTRFTGWQFAVKHTPAMRRDYIAHYLNELRLLSTGELRRFFPEAMIKKERILGWPKSLIAFKR